MSEPSLRQSEQAPRTPGAARAPGAMELSVVVVSFNTRDLTLQCLESVLRESSRIRLEVIVLDNASEDGSAEAVRERFPEVRLIASDENLGFGRACNRAGELASGEFILMLNPDTRVLEGSLQELLRFARECGEGGIVGGRAYGDDGKLDPRSCAGRPTLWSTLCQSAGLSALGRGSRLLDPESLGGWQRDTARRVDVVIGCFMLLPLPLWRRLGGFDDDYWMYGEDVDICLRARDLGLGCKVCPGARFVHVGGASERVREDKMIRLLRGKAQVFERHWSRLAAWTGIRLLDLWVLSRIGCFALLAPFGGRRRDSLRTWRAIWRGRRRWHVL